MRSPRRWLSEGKHMLWHIRLNAAFWRGSPELARIESLGLALGEKNEDQHEKTSDFDDRIVRGDEPTGHAPDIFPDCG